MSGLHDASAIPIRPDLAAAQARAWQRIARPGAWFDSTQRVAIAAETRHAPACGLCRRRRAAMSPAAEAGAHDTLGVLSDGLVEIVHQVRIDPARLTERWYSGVLAAGVTEEQYVETVGIIAQIVAIDTMARGLGREPPSLPTPQPGAPSQDRPRGAKPGPAWVAWVEPEDAEPGTLGHYPTERPAANIQKALSLVPAEAKGFFDLVVHQYLPGSAMRDFSREYRAITHAQIELLAARVSALNQCLYWTTSHALLLRASGKTLAEDYRLEIVTDPAGDDGGVPHGRELIAFADAVLGDDDTALRRARAALQAGVGPEGLADAAGVVGLFNAIDRVADATGIPLEPEKATASADFRAALGLDRFAVANRGWDVG